MNKMDSLIEESLVRFQRERALFREINEDVSDICSLILKRTKVLAQLTARVKSIDSFKGKLIRFAGDPKRKIRSADQALERIKDLSAVRIMTYRPEDQDQVIEELIKEFALRDGQVDRKDKKYYRATHLEVRLLPKHLGGEDDNSSPKLHYCTEVQVCTMMAHVWNEIEHDIGYKNHADELSKSEQRMLDALAQLVRSGDQIISELLDANDQRQLSFRESMTNVAGFSQFVAQRLPDIKVDKNIGQLHTIVRATQMDIKDFLVDCIEPLCSNTGRKNVEKWIEDYNSRLLPEDAPIYFLDTTNTDLLLAQLIKRHTSAIIDALPAGRGKGAPSRARRIAIRYAERVSKRT